VQRSFSFTAIPGSPFFSFLPGSFLAFLLRRQEVVITTLEPERGVTKKAPRKTTFTGQQGSNTLVVLGRAGERAASGPRGLFFLLQPHRFGGQESNMVPQTKAESPLKMPTETKIKLRSLAHDLSNSIETIMQASYLLAQNQLDDTSKKWLELIENAAQDAARINREMRDVLRAQSS
jgi:signal transduction histidine kinase